MKKISVAYLILTLILSLYIISCSDSTIDPAQNGNGRLKIYMVDSPAELDSVIVNVLQVSVHKAGNDTTEGGWTIINDSERYFDLLQLTNGASVVLGDTLLESGKYTQIRLLLGEDNYVYDNGIRYDLTVPSGQQSGLKLIHPFDIIADNLYELYLDFNVDKSVHINGTGQYIIKPTIRVQAAIVSGTISGQVLPLDADAVVWTVSGEDTIATFPNEEGFFKLMALPEGIYDVHVEPENAVYQPEVINDIEVFSNQNTDIGIVTLSN